MCGRGGMVWYDMQRGVKSEWHSLAKAAKPATSVGKSRHNARFPFRDECFESMTVTVQIHRHGKTLPFVSVGRHFFRTNVGQDR